MVWRVTLLRFVIFALCLAGCVASKPVPPVPKKGVPPLPRFAAKSFAAIPRTTPITVAWDWQEADGFRLYSGSESRNYTNMTEVPGDVTEYQLTIPRGVIFLAVTAFDANGESAYSNEITNGLPLHPNRVVMVWQDLTNLLWIATNPVPISQFWTGYNLKISMTNF